MPITIAQQKSGAQNTAVSSLNVSFDNPVTAGNQIVIVYAGDGYVSSGNIPSGFSEPAGARRESFLGHYVWHKVAVGTETTFTITPSQTVWFTWAIFEVAGLSGIGSLLSSGGQHTQTAGNTYSTPTITPTGGERFIFASIAGSLDTGAMTTVSGWTNSFTEIVDVRNTVASGSRDLLAVGVRDASFSASQTTSTSVTWDGGANPQARSSIYLVYNVGGPDATPPSAPGNLRLTQRSELTLTIAWDASTDDVALQDYDILLDGSPTAAATTTATTYTLTGLATLTTYSIRVRARDTTGNVSGLSAALTASTIEGGGRYAWTGTERKLLGRRIYDPANHIASLGLIPWEGGPSYWSQFPKAAAAGWTNPDFFPILIDPCPFGSESEILWDKAHGINVYAGGLNQWTPWNLIGDNGMYFIGEKYTYITSGQMMPDDYPAWVGYRLDDETDGRFDPPQAGFDYLQGLLDTYSARNDGRFFYNNYTQMTCLEAWPYKTQYVNNYTDAVSLDMYWYTIPNSSFGNQYVSSVDGPANPRSATSYGAMVRGLRQVDESDGVKQPVWMYVENFTGSPGEQFVRYITPGELKGAVMSSVIAEARGIMWFNAAMSGPGGATYGNVLRQAQVDTNFPGKLQVEAMGEINNQIHRLAPVINTQSRVYDFGSGLETMLKVDGGYAYIFAMAKNGTTPGSRTFRLPDGLAGSTVEVFEEGRTVPISASRTFVDTFAEEYTYHVYKIPLE